MGEEAPLIPSGTLFFAGCTFNCCFCQNHDISSAGKTHSEKTVGTIISPQRLTEIAEHLGLDPFGSLANVTRRIIAALAGR